MEDGSGLNLGRSSGDNMGIGGNIAWDGDRDEVCRHCEIDRNGCRLVTAMVPSAGDARDILWWVYFVNDEM